MDRLLDEARSGPTYLRQVAIAELVIESLKYGAGLQHCELHAYVVMSNHVHLLITPHVRVPRLLCTLKSSIARKANLVLGRTGERFWQEESYDRLVRNAEEFKKIQDYIELNPVRAGLARSPEDYPWSSALMMVNPG